jgi:hypothetical protein
MLRGWVSLRGAGRGGDGNGDWEDFITIGIGSEIFISDLFLVLKTAGGDTTNAGQLYLVT